MKIGKHYRPPYYSLEVYGEKNVVKSDLTILEVIKRELREIQNQTGFKEN
jgi:hypothetical protein